MSLAVDSDTPADEYASRTVIRKRSLCVVMSFGVSFAALAIFAAPAWVGPFTAFALAVTAFSVVTADEGLYVGYWSSRRSLREQAC